MNLTNQELIQELQKRIKAGTLGAKVVAGELEEETSSLLSKLDGKSWLLLIVMITAFTLAVCYSIKSTSSWATDCRLEFDSNPSLTISSLPTALDKTLIK